MLQIWHIYCSPYHPQTKGKLGRFHETVKARLNLPMFSSPEALRAAMAEFIEYYFGAVRDENTKDAVKATVIARGIKPDKVGMRPRTVLPPAVRSAQQSVKNLMLKKEKLPLQTAAGVVTTEIPADDLEVPGFLRRAQRRKTK